MFVALALLSVAVYLTGSPANHQDARPARDFRDKIHNHSQAAEFAFWSMETLGALSLFALLKFKARPPIPDRFLIGVLVLSMVVFALMLWTAALGWKIRHPEIEGWNLVPFGASLRV